MAPNQSYIPQNTLLGLPRELMDQITGYCVASDAPVDIRSKVLLASFEGLTASSLKDSAESQYYPNNIFVVSIDGDLVNHSCDRRVLVDDPDQRDRIRHLVVKANSIIVDRNEDAPCATVGMAEIGIIKQLPTLYPKLRSLTVQVESADTRCQVCHKGISLFDTTRAERTWALVQTFVTNILRTLRDLQGPHLNAKSVSVPAGTFMPMRHAAEVKVDGVLWTVGETSDEQITHVGWNELWCSCGEVHAEPTTG